jgi:hypothetical protein
MGWWPGHGVDWWQRTIRLYSLHGCGRSGHIDLDSVHGCLASDMQAVKGTLPHVAVYCGPEGLHARFVHQNCIGQKPKLYTISCSGLNYEAFCMACFWLGGMSHPIALALFLGNLHVTDVRKVS